MRKSKKNDELDTTVGIEGASDEAIDELTDIELTPEDEFDPEEKSAPADRDVAGPYDETEANSVRPYIDLGGIKILPRDGLNLRLEVEEATQRIVAVSLDYAGSTLQVQAFSAPRSTGLWHEIREQIRTSIAGQGGTVTDNVGELGAELLTQLGDPSGVRPARFVGVDGPRWFLRGVIAGAGGDPANTEAVDAINDLFRSVVVVRGDTPMPPRDLLALKMPVTPGTV